MQRISERADRLAPERRPRPEPPVIEDEAPPPRRIRRWLVLVSIVVILAATVVAAGWGWSSAPEAPAFATAAVRRATIEDSVSALGNLQPQNYVDVGTQVSGQLQKIHVAVGDGVTQGQLLAEIDPIVWQARVDANRAQLGNLTAQLQEREARLTLARQLRDRQRNLRRLNATSDEALEQAEAELAVTTAQIAAIRAQRGQTESQLRADQANLGYTRIYAPIAGTVVSITARRGQTLNANQSAPIILRVADLATMTVTTQVSEADIGRLRVGQEAYFSTLGDPDTRYIGTLRQIMPTPEILNNVVLYHALFDVPNAAGRLMTQMTAQVFFVVARAEDALTVPASALRASGEGSQAVLVMQADGSVARRPVETGLVTRTVAEIRDGLAEGEQVVTGPAPAGDPAAGSFRPRLG